MGFYRILSVIKIIFIVCPYIFEFYSGASTQTPDMCKETDMAGKLFHEYFVGTTSSFLKGQAT